MKLILFSVHDSKAEAFIQPFYASNVATGLRMFQAAANDPETQFHRFAGDYTLFELGSFEQDSAKFDIYKTPINHGLALSFKTAPVPIYAVEAPTQAEIDFDIAECAKSTKARDKAFIKRTKAQ